MGAIGPFPSEPDDTSFDLPAVPNAEAPPEQLRQDLLQRLRKQFPHLCAWYGEATRHWWAMLGGRLVERETAAALAETITRWRAGDAIE
jgi:hypothetical protein